MNKLSFIDLIAKILVIVGGLNWGLVGIFQIDLVASLLGGGDATALLPRAVYSLVGVAALWMVYGLFKKA